MTELENRPVYSIKDYVTRPIVTKINAEENALREAVMAEIIETHKPYSIPGTPNESALRVLAEKNVLALNAADAVTSIYPVSALETNKKVLFEDGRFAYAMCAIDAIGFHYAFDCPIRIEGQCEHCGDPIVLEVKDGKVTVVEGGDDVYVLHTDLENTEDWSCCCCNVMHFFSCKASLEAWQTQNHTGGKVIPVNLETANKIAWLLFSK